MQLKELNKLKAAMTMPSINERAAYARHHENRPHLASFCGTGNNVQFLSDPTGTRRWLPFEVVSIESPLSQPFNGHLQSGLCALPPGLPLLVRQERDPPAGPA